jgi:hypothetical protein
MATLCLALLPISLVIAADAGAHPTDFVGSWRVFSERIFYDLGGAGAWTSASAGTATTRLLEIHADGKWDFGSSKGTWEVQPIGPTDWQRWRVKPYGPTRKMVLSHWHGSDDSIGAIEETSRVNFFWVRYHVEPPLVHKPGTIKMKFGHAASHTAPETPK